MAYLQKISVTVAGTSKNGVEASSYISQGFIEAVDIIPGPTNPFPAGSSFLVKIRLGSTVGRLIFRSSSGITNANRYYYPRRKVSNSTAGKDSSSLSGKIPVYDDTLYVIRQGSATGTTQIANVRIFLS